MFMPNGELCRAPLEDGLNFNGHALQGRMGLGIVWIVKGRSETQAIGRQVEIV